MRTMCALVALELLLATAVMAAFLVLEAVVSRIDRGYRLPTIGV